MKKRKQYVKTTILICFVLLIGSSILPNINAKINENDTKKQSQDYPYYLKDTILCSNTKVVVTEDGTTPKNLDPSLYDVVLSFEEQDLILEEARNEYIETYGIDPINTKESNKPISNLFKFPLRKLCYNGICESHHVNNPKKQTGPGGPHQIGGSMCLNVFFAKDTKHRVRNIDAAVQDAKEGWKKYRTFDIACDIQFFYNVWDAADEGYDNEQLLWDIQWELADYILDESHLILGFVEFAYNNGMAYINGHQSVVAHNTQWINFDDELIVTHEISHNIGGMEDSWFGHGRCYMEYYSLFLFSYLGIFFEPQWCDECYDLIYDGIWQ